MNAVRVAAESLEAALKAAEGVRVYRDPSAQVDPPGVVIGPPALAWDGYCAEPTSATFTVWAITAFSDRTLERLWDLAPQISAAVDEMTDAAVTRANPSMFNAGGTDLPAYELTVEVAL